MGDNPGEWCTSNSSPKRHVFKGQHKPASFSFGNLDHKQFPANQLSSIKRKLYLYFLHCKVNQRLSFIVEPNVDGSNYFLNGTLKVYTTTSQVTIITNDDGDITSVHRTSDSSVMKAYGELNVTNNWSKFTLAINGIDPLTGTVFRSVQRQMEFNPFKVTDDTNTAVTGSDVSAVIKVYGAMSGWGNYDVKMDFCGHYKIDNSRPINSSM
jgi:hypothetical protein